MFILQLLMIAVYGSLALGTLGVLIYMACQDFKSLRKISLKWDTKRYYRINRQRKYYNKKYK